MKYLASLLLVLLCLSTAAAQQSLTPLTPHESTLTVPGETDTWTFSGLEGGVISLLAVSDGELDPVIELRNSGGQMLITNDDFAYPGRRDALLQAITLPRIDTYSVGIYGFGGTIGSYTLTMIPGYAEIAAEADFETAAPWTTDGTESADADVADGRLTLTLDGMREWARMERGALGAMQDFYAQADFDIQRGSAGWRAGFSLRGTDDGFYALMLNDSGAWRMDFVDADGTSRQIRDWTVHPAILPGATDFRLGVLVNGPAFDVYFNGGWVGQAVETQSDAPDNGLTGFYGGTPDAVGAAAVISFDNLLVTRPLRVGEIDVMPSALIPGGQALTVQELERRRVVPTGGSVALNVPESSGRQVEPGVNRVLLGRGASFSDFVLHTSFTLTTGTPDALVGCGLLFANASDTRHAVAFLDRQGGYGVSARDGDNYSPGLFGENPAFAGGQRHTLILVKRGLRAELFVDRQHVGGYDLPAGFDVPGQIGNAVVNYQRSDTSCSFSDTWVWRLP